MWGTGAHDGQHSGLTQLTQKHQNGEGQLQPSPVSEDIACESEVPSEPDSQQRQSDHRRDAPGSQTVPARSRRLRRALGWDDIVHGSASCHGPDRREAVPERKFTEPVALLSTQPADLPLPRMAVRRSFNLLALRARCEEEPMGESRRGQVSRPSNCRSLRCSRRRPAAAGCQIGVRSGRPSSALATNATAPRRATAARRHAMTARLTCPGQNSQAGGRRWPA